MEINRIVSNIHSNNLEESKKFYIDFLEMDLVMDMGWVLTFASYKNPSAQITILKSDENKKLNNEAIFLSIEVAHLDTLYENAQISPYEITYPITNEPWGVRRFFIKDPNGATINFLMHQK